MKSRAYMKEAEFKARQGWLPFVDAVGVALQLLEPMKAKTWHWFRKWRKTRYRPVAPAAKAEQLNLWTAFTINQYRLDYVQPKGKIMELEIYEAFVSAGVKEDKAKAVVESINREMDKRYAANADKLATKADIADVKINIAEAKTEVIKWCVGAMFAAVGLFATITKLWH